MIQVINSTPLDAEQRNLYLQHHRYNNSSPTRPSEFQLSNERFPEVFSGSAPILRASSLGQSMIREYGASTPSNLTDYHHQFQNFRRSHGHHFNGNAVHGYPQKHHSPVMHNNQFSISSSQPMAGMGSSKAIQMDASFKPRNSLPVIGDSRIRAHQSSQAPGSSTSPTGSNSTTVSNNMKRKRCKMMNCFNFAVKEGLCKSHGGYIRCCVEDCHKHAVKEGMCRRHYLAIVKPCAVDGCERYAKMNGMCLTHGRDEKKPMLDLKLAECKKEEVPVSPSSESHSTAADDELLKK